MLDFKISKQCEEFSFLITKHYNYITSIKIHKISTKCTKKMYYRAKYSKKKEIYFNFFNKLSIT